jgi:hypothetical protein
MTRDEVVKGLEGMFLGVRDEFHTWEAGVLRAAIAILTPPTTAEIEAARSGVITSNARAATLNRALDALAREPAREAICAATETCMLYEMQRTNEEMRANNEKSARISSMEAEMKRASDNYHALEVEAATLMAREKRVRAVSSTMHFTLHRMEEKGFDPDRETVQCTQEWLTALDAALDTKEPA